MLAFQHLQASLRCCRMTRALFCLIPSGIMSRMSCMTAARSSKSKWLSTLCLVTVLATPLECLPSNCLARRLPSQRSKRGTTPRRKNSHTLQPGAQNPHPGPFPTGPCNKDITVLKILECYYLGFVTFIGNYFKDSFKTSKIYINPSNSE